jgi:predicted nuclease of predicted toxin-antitoxin system
MKAVVDEDLPRSFAKMLSSLGFEVFDVRDFGLRGKSDKKVFDFAQRHKAVLFSATLGLQDFFVIP